MSYDLDCFILGSMCHFSVQIGETKTVDSLKNAMKEKIPHTLANVHAAALALYRAEIDKPDDDETFMHEIKRLSENLHECKGLLPWRALSAYFREEPPAGKIYIILVQIPEGESIYCRSCR